jgi:hypothetical protein
MQSPLPSRSSGLHRRRDLVALFAVALLANGLAAYFISRPGYMDAYYYFGSAVQLAHGQGFAEPYVWNYLDPIRQLPHPSHLYWMPLPALVAAPFVALGERLAGTALPNAALFRVAQVPFVLLASALPLLSYTIASLTSPLRRHALAAACLTLFSGFYFAVWTNTDAFALYGLTAGGALFAYGLTYSPTHSHRPRPWLFLSGLLAGLAHLTRADGVIVLGILLLLELISVRPGILSTTHSASRLAPLLLLLLGYLLIMLPWFLRSLLLVGTPLAPGSARALWLTEYNDLFTFPADKLTLARYLASGWGNILAGKWWALKLNFGRLIAEQGTIFVFPFVLIGLWKLRRNGLYAPAILYGFALFALMTVVFTFPGPRGGLFHSAAALLPFFFSAALAGLDASVDAVARVLPHWQPDKSKPVFTALLVLGAVAVTALIFQLRVVGVGGRNLDATRTDTAYAEIGDWLAGQRDAQGVVAANNPPAFYYWTGHPSIVVPAGSADDLLNAMAAFGARWVVLDVNHTEGLNALYALPNSDSRLRLRATFTDAAGKPVYLFEMSPNP